MYMIHNFYLNWIERCLLFIEYNVDIYYPDMYIFVYNAYLVFKQLRATLAIADVNNVSLK